MTTTGLVLAAGSSSRFGRPKQLLPYRGATLLDAVLDLARRCRFEQIVVALGAAASEVRLAVDLAGVDVVDNVAHTSGCSSSIVAALAAVEPASDGVVLLLGDQPGVQVTVVHELVEAGASSPVAVCRYDDGRGHPFWFRRDVFADLATLHGDKGVWKLLESGRHAVAEVSVRGPVPVDVDTPEDYERLLGADGDRP